jgi:hypothetical protein
MGATILRLEAPGALWPYVGERAIAPDYDVLSFLPGELTAAVRRAIRQTKLGRALVDWLSTKIKNLRQGIAGGFGG